MHQGPNQLFAAHTVIQTWRHAIEKLKVQGMFDPFNNSGRVDQNSLPLLDDVQIYGSCLREVFTDIAFLGGGGKMKHGMILQCHRFDDVKEDLGGDCIQASKIKPTMLTLHA